MEPFSLSSNTESLSYTAGGSSGQWSLHANADSSWSAGSIGMSLTCQQAPFMSTDHNFTLNHTQFDSHDFRSLPNNVAIDSYDVPAGQVDPFSLSLFSSSHLHESAANGMAWIGEQQMHQQLGSASVCSTLEHVAPIPAFVSSASYDDGMSLCSKSTNLLKLVLQAVYIVCYNMGTL